MYVYIYTHIYSKSSLSTYKTTTVIENAELEWTMVPNKHKILNRQKHLKKDIYIFKIYKI